MLSGYRVRLLVLSSGNKLFINSEKLCPRKISFPLRDQRVKIFHTAPYFIAKLEENKNSSRCKRKMSKKQKNKKSAYQTSFDYVIRFYPRWFSYKQQNDGQMNKIFGPIKMSPKYG